MTPSSISRFCRTGRILKNWFENGAIDATVRANRIYQRLLGRV